MGIHIDPMVNPKIIKEALSRMGIANKKEHILYPSCYLTLDPSGLWTIYHFKELFPFLTDGLDQATDTDTHRRNSIVGMVQNWNLITVIDDSFFKQDNFVFVLKKAQKEDWEIKHKINLKKLNLVELSR